MDRCIGEQKNICTAVVLLDLSAAFDVVDSTILLQKMKVYGFDDSSNSWIESYLSNRAQCVYIDGALSEVKELEAGVPQGSIFKLVDTEKAL